MSPLKIGPLTLPDKPALAPMAGLTNLPFRLLCKEQGAGLIYSEMISAEALIRDNKKTLCMLKAHPEEEPLVYQICGGRKETLRDAVVILQERGAKIIDLNLGCPVPKIAKSNAGATLARNIPLVEEILTEMVKAATVPITIKLRKGWDDSSVNCLDLCRIAQDCGVDLVSLHGRTARQGYGGKADWEIIRSAREILSIPLMGNGDVTRPERAKEMMETTGCDGVMIGRAALGNPWIFKETSHYLETGNRLPEPAREERHAVMVKHLDLLIREFGSFAGIRLMRKFWGYYIHDWPGSAQLRGRLVTLEDEKEIVNTLREFFEKQSEPNTKKSEKNDKVLQVP